MGSRRAYAGDRITFEPAQRALYGHLRLRSLKATYPFFNELVYPLPRFMVGILNFVKTGSRDAIDEAKKGGTAWPIERYLCVIGPGILCDAYQFWRTLACDAQNTRSDIVDSSAETCEGRAHEWLEIHGRLDLFERRRLGADI